MVEKMTDEVIKELRPYENMNRHDFYIFEPKGFVQKFRALFQNTYEIQIITGVILFCFADPNLFSLVILAMTTMLFQTSILKPESKIIWGCVMIFILACTNAYFFVNVYGLASVENAHNSTLETYSNYTSMERNITRGSWFGFIYDNVTL